MTAPTFPLPTIHLNGTSRETLRNEYHEAYKKLIEFRDAFAATTCNARDYYIQGPDAYPRARAARDEQFRKIAELMQYLEAHLMEFAE